MKEVGSHSRHLFKKRWSGNVKWITITLTGQTLQKEQLVKSILPAVHTNSVMSFITTPTSTSVDPMATLMPLISLLEVSMKN